MLSTDSEAQESIGPRHQCIHHRRSNDRASISSFRFALRDSKQNIIAIQRSSNGTLLRSRKGFTHVKQRGRSSPGKQTIGKTGTTAASQRHVSSSPKDTTTREAMEKKELARANQMEYSLLADTNQLVLIGGDDSEHHMATVLL